MSPKETVVALYAAYASRDPAQIAELLHKDVTWIAPAGNATQVAFGLGDPEEAGPPAGRNNLDHQKIVHFMAYNFSRFFKSAKIDFRSMVCEGDVVITEHRMSAELPNGRSYINDYCFAYQVRDGKVVEIREYMDTRGGWAQVFGEDNPETLLEFAKQ